MGSPIDLELRGIRKTFGRTVAVDDLSLAAERGELVALLGPSGCGKTTTLWIVAGFEHLDAGEVRISQRPVTTLPANRRDVGMVFQNYALFPHMTVFENIAYGLRRRGLARAVIGERVARILDLVRLQGLEGRYPRQLSGGQQQRVAVGRAIVIQPSVLLLDEPLSNLDAKLRQEMRGELRRLQQRLEITTLFVTHDQDEALSMADRVAVMNGGRVEQVGTPEEIYDRPATRFVANFIGECNFLAGRVEEIRGAIIHFAVGRLRLKIANGLAAAVSGEGILALRPEDIRVLGEGEPAGPAANVVQGRVREVMYLGAWRRYRVALDEHTEVLIAQQHGHGRSLHEGDLVRLGWEPTAGTFQTTEPPR